MKERLQTCGEADVGMQFLARAKHFRIRRVSSRISPHLALSRLLHDAA